MVPDQVSTEIHQLVGVAYLSLEILMQCEKRNYQNIRPIILCVGQYWSGLGAEVLDSYSSKLES